MDFLHELDKKGFFYVHHLQKFNLDPLLAWPTALGSLIGALCIVLIAAAFKNRKKFAPHFLYGILPLIITFYITKYLKIYFEVPRPFIHYTLPEDAINVIFARPENFSFPSGHASMAFALATVLAGHFKINHYAVYSLALLVCLTRLYVGVHYPSDVIVGSFIGWGITALFLKLTKTNLAPS